MKHSAGVILIRYRDGTPEMLLAKPGGPFWQHKDEGAWGMIKGEIEKGEDPRACARREFHEETGIALPKDIQMIEVEPFRQSSYKTIHPFVAKCDLKVDEIHSNLTSEGFPELESAEWFSLNIARQKIMPGQSRLVDEVKRILGEMTT